MRNNSAEKNLIISRIHRSDNGAIPLPNSINKTARILRPKPDLLQELELPLRETHFCEFRNRTKIKLKSSKNLRPAMEKKRKLKNGSYGQTRHNRAGCTVGRRSNTQFRHCERENRSRLTVRWVCCTV